MPRYDDDKRYMMTGAALNALHREVATNRLIAGGGLGLRRIPGQGTEVWTDGAAAAGRRLWDVEVDDETGKVKISEPGRIRKTAEWSKEALVDISGIADAHSVGVGSFLALVVNVDGEVELKAVSSWTGHPWSWETEPDENGFEIFQRAIYPLYAGIEPPEQLSPRRHVSVSEFLALERLAPDCDLALMETLEQHPGGGWTAVPALVPDWGAPSI